MGELIDYRGMGAIAIGPVAGLLASAGIDGFVFVECDDLGRLPGILM